MIRKDFTLEDTNDRYEVDVTDEGLNDIDEESFLADTLSEAVTHLKNNGYKCSRKSGYLWKPTNKAGQRGRTPHLNAMIWHNGFTVGDPEIVYAWATA
tara:strand:- start:1304 stop:1597 length:294 start_codon:yes stop_codon:yes gene_type:complete